MAQGPDGGGFKMGHRASKSLYADKVAVAEPATSDETNKALTEESRAAGAAVAATPTGYNEVDVTKTVLE